MSVTYDAPSNTVTINGEGSAGSPFFYCSGIYDADQSGGWGVFTRANVYQYNQKAKVIITGDSYVVDDSRQILIDELIVAETEFIVRVENGYMRWGYTNDAENYDARGGVCVIHLNSVGKTYILWNDDSNGSFDLYGCHFRNIGNNLGIIRNTNGRLWHNRLENTYFHGGGPNTNSYNNTIQVVYRGYSTFYPGTINLRDKVFQATYWIVTPGTSMNGAHVKNIYARGCESLVNIQDQFSGTGNVLYVGQGFDVVNWEVNFRYWVTGNPKVVREHLVTLTIVDQNGSPLEGATVTLYDTDSSEVFSVTTGANGLVEQLVQRSYCQKTWADDAYEEDIKLNLDTNATKDYSPHLLRVTKTGHDTVEIPFTLSGDTTWKVQCPKTVGPMRVVFKTGL